MTSAPHSIDSFFDYCDVEGFSKGYIDTYYRIPPTADERALVGFVTQVLARVELPRVGGGAIEHLDAACGPTVHHALAFSRFVDRIWMADYLPENLQAVYAWWKASRSANDWSHYTRLALELQASAVVSPAEVARYEAQTREKIAGLLHCDFKRQDILEQQKLFSSVGCFYGAEVVAKNPDAFAQIIYRLAAITAHEGYLFLATIGEAKSYVFCQRGNVKRRLPTVCLCKNDLAAIFRRGPFSEFELEEAPTDDNTIEGVNKVFLAAARVRAA